MNGTLIPQTPIAVDFWKIRECPQARIFFLTHLHGDHITGLTSSWSFPIYCSEITGKLLVQRYCIQEGLIHNLQTECAEIIYLDNEHKEQMTVTTIEANHCPGAVMFLMQGYFGTILHTGDFRYHQDMITQSLLSDLSGKVDILYLDNTYCSPGCVFPTKDDATSQIIEIIEKHPNKDVLIAMRNLGKENLLCKIAIHFNEWISVPDIFHRTLEILEAPNVFDTGFSNNRIRIVPFHKISNKFVEIVNEERETIVILPTALYQGIECTPYENNENVFVVPYSDHSSYTELVDFVSFIKPKKIIPIVKSNARGPFGLSIADRADMACFDKFISHGWNSKIEIPVSVQAFMNCQNHNVLLKEGKGKKRKMRQKPPQTKKLKRGVAYDSPLSVAKQKTSSPILASEQKLSSTSKSKQKARNQVSASKQKAKSPMQASVQETVENKDNKENSKNACNDLSHVRQLLFDEIAEKHSQVDNIQVQEDSIELTRNEMTTKKHFIIKNHSDQQLRLVSKQHVNVIKYAEVCDGNSERNVSKGSEGIHKDICRKSSPDKNRRNTRERLCKRTVDKKPLQFTSMNKDSSFDNVFGMRTYSKANKRFLCANDLIVLKRNVDEEDSKMNEIAKWVLESSQFEGDPECQMEGVADVSEDSSLVNEISDFEKDWKSVSPAYERKVYGKKKSIERKKTKASVLAVKPKVSSGKKSGGSRKPQQTKLRIGKENDKNGSDREVVKNGQLNVSVHLKQLKQSTLSQYVTKTKSETKTNPKETASLEEELYFATKLCEDSGDAGESLSEEDVYLNASKMEEVSQQNSNEIKENNKRINYCDLTEDESVIITESDLEEKFKELITAKKNTSKEHVGKKNKTKLYLSRRNESKTHFSKEEKGKRHSSDRNGSNAEVEMFVEQDAFDESLLAQIGTHVRHLNVSIDDCSTEKNKVKYTVKSNDTVGKLVEKNEQSCVVNSVISTNNSFSCLNNRSGGDEASHDNENDGENNESLEIIGASKCCEEGDTSTFDNVGSQNKNISAVGNKSTVSKASTELWTCSNNDANLSTLANVGSQKEVLAVRNIEGTVNENITNLFQSQFQEHIKLLNKVGKEISYCRECELDAFQQACDDLEIDEVNKVDGPQSKEYETNHVRITQRRFKEKFRPVIKCSFSVKPINVS